MSCSNSNQFKQTIINHSAEDSIEELVDQVKRASLLMTQLSSEQRRRILEKVAEAIKDNAGKILEANKQDILSANN